METNILATALAMSDQDLLTRLDALARTEREATAELVAHLTALEQRPSLYAGQGYGSLFDYCTTALRLSEDAACSRINAVRAGKRFPLILDYLAEGTVTLTSVRLLAPHLTAENHEAVLARARNKRHREIQALVAELAPRPDVPSSVRKLPVPKAAESLPVLKAAPCVLDWTAGASKPVPTLNDASPGAANVSSPVVAPTLPGAPPVSSPEATLDEDGAAVGGFRLQSQLAPSPNDRPIVEPLAPQRYRVQFTIGQEAHDDLRTVQALLRREIPNGDPGAIFERALALLRREVEKAKLGVVAKPRAGARSQGRIYEKRIRSKTDKGAMDSLPGRERRDPEGSQAAGIPGEVKTTGAPGNVLREIKAPCAGHERPASRHIPNAVKRAVWYRDRGQCAFVSATGRRCAERNFLELHHIHPYALEGPATIGNISLRCRRHNQYEAELVFAVRGVSTDSERRERSS